MGERVLVTGGCGFIGRWLVRALMARGDTLAVLDDLSTGSTDGLPAGVTVHRGDVCDPATVRTAARGSQRVMHLAGVVGMRLAMGDRARAYSVAVEGTRAVLAQTGDVPVVLFSSSAVYGLTGDAPVPEDSPVDEDSLRAYDGGAQGYAAGKRALEHMGLAAAEGGRPVLLVRPFNVVGPGQSARYGMVLPTLVTRALAGEALEVYDDGAQSRCFSEVRAWNRTLLRVMDIPAAWKPGSNVVNLGSARSERIEDVARAVLALTGSRSPVVHVPYERVFPGRKDVRARVPDVTRVEGWLGPVDWPDLDTILRALVADAHTNTRRPA